MIYKVSFSDGFGDPYIFMAQTHEGILHAIKMAIRRYPNDQKHIKDISCELVERD